MNSVSQVRPSSVYAKDMSGYKLKPFGLVALLLVTVGLLSGAIRQSKLYNRPHIWESASDWIYASIPKGSVILGVHWDDSLPLQRGDKDPRAFRVSDANQLPLYEADTSEKLRGVCEQLAGGDFLILPTQRLQGSIPRIPDEQPDTTRLFGLLFNAKIGYEPLVTFKEHPSLLGWQLRTDTADESLSVYDHPKVTILKNVGLLDADEIERRVIAARSMPAPTVKELLEFEGPLLGTPENTIQNPWLALLVWYIVLTLIGFLVAPAIASIFPNARDLGFGFGKTAGLFLLGCASWLTSILFHINIDPWTLLAILALTAPIFQKSFQSLFIKRLELLRAELAFAFGFFLFLILRVYQPEIFWGEKPMDFTFLNFFIRNPSLPPEDPWSAGQNMHYYYLGTYVLAWFHRLTGIDSALGYNLSIATLGGMITAGTYTLSNLIIRSRGLALLAATSISLGSNLATLWLVLKGEKVSFDGVFWPSSRALAPPNINEYPVWSLLFADLHAHLIAIPLGLVLLGSLAAVVLGDRRISPFMLMGLSLGALFGVNSWDFILYGALIGLGALMMFFPPLPLVGLSIATAILFLPQYLVAIGGARISFDVVRGDDFNSFFQVFLHFGLLLMMLGTALLSREFWKKPRLLSVLLVVLSFEFIVLIIGHYAERPPPWGILALGLTLTVLGLSTRYGLFLAAFGILLTSADCFFLMDRMNTIFKSYNILWWISGAAVLFAIRASESDLQLARTRRALLTLLAVLAISGTAINSWIMTRSPKVDGPQPTLNGMAYLSEHWPDDSQLILFLRDRVAGLPTILEAQGPSYQDFTRISMNTGLPVVLGWDYHVEQRGTPSEEINRRKSLVTLAYRDSDPARVNARLQKAKVRFVIVSDLERKTYPGPGTTKFSEAKRYFTRVFKSGAASVYLVNWAA